MLVEDVKAILEVDEMLIKCFEVLPYIIAAHYYSQHFVFSSYERLIAILNFIEQTVFRFICNSKVLAKKYNHFKKNKESS